MSIHVNIKTNTEVEKQLGNHIWPFEKRPKLPLQKHGYTWHVGWDIPTRWAIDDSGQRWEDNGHGHDLKRKEKNMDLQVVDTDNVCGKILAPKQSSILPDKMILPDGDCVLVSLDEWKFLHQPSPRHKLFAVYHHHEYGSTQWLLWSDILPTEEQVVTTLGIDFEPEKDEFIAVEEIVRIHTLELS